MVRKCLHILELGQFNTRHLTEPLRQGNTILQALKSKSKCFAQSEALPKNLGNSFPRHKMSVQSNWKPLKRHRPIVQGTYKENCSLLAC